MVNRKTIIVDFYKPHVIPTYTFYQFDNNQIEFVIEQNGQDANLSNVSRAVVNIKRPDGKIFSRELDIEDNIIVYPIQNAEMKVSGTATLSLQFYNEVGERISTAQMKIYFANTIESRADFDVKDGTLYQKIIMEMAGLKDQLFTLNRESEEKGNYAQEKGDYALEKAREVEKVVEDAREEITIIGGMKQEVEDVIQTANEAVQSVGEVLESAESKGSYAQEKGDYAKEQADLAAQRTEELANVDAAQFKKRQDEFSAQLAEKATKQEISEIVASGGKSTLTASSTSIDVTEWAMAIANVELQWGSSHFEGSYDGGNTFTKLNVINTETQSVFSRIDMRGRYSVDLRGVTHLKYIVDYTAGGLVNNPQCAIDVFTVHSTSFIAQDRKPRKRYAPDNFITGSITPLVSNRILSDVDLKTGTMYATSGPNITKSTNYNASWVSVIANPQTPWGLTTLNEGAVRKLNSGKLLVVIRNNNGNTQIYLSDTNEANFQLVYEFPVEGVVSPGFGLTVHENIILFAPYRQQVRLANEPLRLHMSKDGGSTWSVIHSAPAVDSWHYHDAVYDPYRHRIWVTNGDNYGLANVLYSDNMGVTWHKFWEDGKAKTQFTNINVFPDCVVFGTDQVGMHGVYIWYPNNSGEKDVFEPIYFRGLPGRPGDATYRGKQPWETGGVAYMSSINPNVILATKDGVNYYQMWVKDSTATADRVNSFLGVDVNGKLFVLGSIGAMIVDAPTWSEI